MEIRGKKLEKQKKYFAVGPFFMVISLLIFGFMPDISGPCWLRIQVIIVMLVSELIIDSR